MQSAKSVVSFLVFVWFWLCQLRIIPSWKKIQNFIVYGEVVLEIKAAKTLAKEDEAQIINSLKISGHKIGLLINFGEASLRCKRFIN